MGHGRGWPKNNLLKHREIEGGGGKKSAQGREIKTCKEKEGKKTKKIYILPCSYYTIIINFLMLLSSRRAEEPANILGSGF